MCGCGHLVMVKVGDEWLQWGCRRCGPAIRRVEIAPSRDVLGPLSLIYFTLVQRHSPSPLIDR
jgi:hypothetical protein